MACEMPDTQPPDAGYRLQIQIVDFDSTRGEKKELARYYSWSDRECGI
jgi:hypothetical protein